MSVKDDYAPMAQESLPPKPADGETEDEARSCDRLVLLVCHGSSASPRAPA